MKLDQIIEGRVCELPSAYGWDGLTPAFGRIELGPWPGESKGSWHCEMRVLNGPQAGELVKVPIQQLRRDYEDSPQLEAVLRSQREEDRRRQRYLAM